MQTFLSKGKSLIIVICSVFAIMITMGTRQSFGLFLPPMTADLGIGRETFSLAAAISNIMFGLPLVAIIADKIGARWAVMAGVFFMGSAYISCPGPPNRVVSILIWASWLVWP